MAAINVLPKHLAELIAAGEVVERPASVIKELCENSIDAGATKITIEIQHGGITYMRVTDNGSGIAHSEVPTAFLRHATSKITKKEDLFSIGTLGFRGEALASVSSVSKVELLTKTKNSNVGTRYVIEGGTEKEYDEAGCPDGTTIIVRDIFFNTPARMKFLKKDASEAMAVAAVVDNIALSNPNVSVKFIKDSKTVISTNGDGNITSVIYEVLGREFSSAMLPVDATTKGIRVHGMTCKPINCRSTRSGQYFFLNGRMIRSAAAAKALDTAYKNSMMVGKFPACVLYIEILPEMVDVNVHPAKTEVRFADDSAVFEAVYYAVKNGIVKGDTRPELSLSHPVTKPAKSTQSFNRMSVEEYKKLVGTDKTPAEKLYEQPAYRQATLHTNETVMFNNPTIEIPKLAKQESKPEEKTAFFATPEPKQKFEYKKFFEDSTNIQKSNAKPLSSYAADIDLDLRYIGEAFKTYIMVELNDSIFFIDKHAAHERILYERFKKNRTIETQLLLSPVAVTLSRAEHRAMLDNLPLLKQAGFEIEEFGTVSVLVRAVPAELVNEDIMFITCEVADSLLNTGVVENEKLEDLYHTVACRAAIKGGNNQSAAELCVLAKLVLSNNDIMYCPHGRPVAFELKKSELERQFGRTN